MTAAESTGSSTPERIRRKLRRAGGSKAVVLPKVWLDRLGAGDDVELVESEGGILILPVQREHSIEDEPEFAPFLSFIVKDAMGHPEALGDMADLVEGNDELFRDVEVQ